MARSPLVRKTPMPRQRKPLPRSTLRPVSDRRRGEAAARSAAREEVARRAKGRCQAEAKWRSVQRDPNCDDIDKACAARFLAGCAGYGTDAHEILPRSRGGDHLDPDGMLWLCRSCHDKVTFHHQGIRLGRKLGLLQSGYSNRKIVPRPT